MKICTIVATYNSQDTIARCLKSIRDQTFACSQLMVIDGCSSDETVGRIREFSADLTYFISEPDTGIYNAWNKALKKTDADWIVFLGGDDYYHDKEVLQKMAPFLERADSLGRNLVYGRCVSVSESGAVFGSLGELWEANNLNTHMMPPHPGLFHSQRIFAEFGFFDERYKLASDYNLLVKELGIRPPLFVDEILTTVITYGGASVKLWNIPRLIREDLAIRKEHKLPLLDVRLLIYYLGLVRNAFERK